MEISIVIPILNEEKNIAPLFNKIKEVLSNRKYEIIFIDDGSTDNSFKELEKVYKTNKNIKIIKFRKNFSKSPALLAGFNEAKGKIIITLDGDLQNNPEDIPRFIEKINQGYDLVNGWRIKRKDNRNKIVPSKIYNKLNRKILNIKLHDLNCGMKAIKKEILDDIGLYGEMHRFIPLFALNKGYKITEIKIKHHPRIHGKSKYNYTRLFKGASDLIYLNFWLKYKEKPSYFFTKLAIIQYLIAFILFIEQFIKLLTSIKDYIAGPLIFLAVLFSITGTLFLTTGFLAEIQLTKVSDRKPYSIEKILKKDE
ncbi:MAG TPA: glycosyltransferase family 2 protein [Candidatus Nanoarchaeia archaeon]|nr:glycosyltransferase family 2 protein [Candidatus Nanoarchaeia archaeon]